MRGRGRGRGIERERDTGDSGERGELACGSVHLSVSFVAENVRPHALKAPLRQTGSSLVSQRAAPVTATVRIRANHGSLLTIAPAGSLERRGCDLVDRVRGHASA